MILCQLRSSGMQGEVGAVKTEGRGCWAFLLHSLFQKNQPRGLAYLGAKGYLVFTTLSVFFGAHLLPVNTIQFQLPALCAP